MCACLGHGLVEVGVGLFLLGCYQAKEQRRKDGWRSRDQILEMTKWDKIFLWMIFFSLACFCEVEREKLYAATLLMSYVAYGKGRGESLNTAVTSSKPHKNAPLSTWDTRSRFWKSYTWRSLYGICTKICSKWYITFKDLWLNLCRFMAASGGCTYKTRFYLFKLIITLCLLPLVPQNRSRLAIGAFFSDGRALLVGVQTWEQKQKAADLIIVTK